MLEASTSTKRYGRQLSGTRARERQPSGSLRCGSGQIRNGGWACTAEDFTDVQLKTVGPPGLADLS